METDKTTLTDLSIFHADDELSVFSKINLCPTIRGKEKLQDNFCKPLRTVEAIKDIQKTIRFIQQHQHLWPNQISNGTIMVIEKYFLSAIDEIPENPTSFSAFSYKMFHGPDFSLAKYSVQHCFDFIKGIQLLIKNFNADAAPDPLKAILNDAKKIIDNEQLVIVSMYMKSIELTIPLQLKLAHFIRYRFKQQMHALLDMYAQLDAWYGMALAVQKYQLVFPEFSIGNQPFLQTKGLYHILLDRPVSYDVNLIPGSNFLFLTGANMAGKSTFIKSVGAAVFLAHIGMGVPATEMKLSFFDGLLSNINVTDNLSRGESYFYNEVQRIKSTVSKISDGKKWLILIDELFKGTNVEDAMKCSSAVIEGLVKIRQSIFILSTHLYEIADALKVQPNIQFNYFETSVINEKLVFNYQLKTGVSNDRLGYLILKNEGVVEMLENL